MRFSECQSPRANAKPLIVKIFWRRFWFKSHMLSRDRFVATKRTYEVFVVCCFDI